MGINEIPSLELFLKLGDGYDENAVKIITRLCEMTQYDPEESVRKMAIENLQEIIGWKPVVEVVGDYLCFGEANGGFRVNVGLAKDVKKNYFG